MTINGRDITEYGKVKQWTVELGTRDSKNDTEWERGSCLPLFQTPNFTFKSLDVTLMVYGESRDDIMHRISDILADCTGVTEITLDKWGHSFTGILDKSGIKEVSDTSMNRFLKLELEFDVYEHGENYVASVNGSTTGGSGSLSIEIDNPGNIVSPAIIEITPLMGQSSVEITGICHNSETGADLPVTISNTTTGKVITLDGITGLITEDGELKAGDVDIWALPSLWPGQNIITIDTRYVNMTVTVMPLYA